MQPGDKVKVVLREVLDGIDQSIQGATGVIDSCNTNVHVPFGFCVRIGSFLFGISEEDLEVIEDDQTTTNP